MADEKTIDELLAPFKKFEREATKGAAVNYQRIEELMALRADAEGVKDQLVARVDAVTNEINKELRAWHKKQQAILVKQGVIPAEKKASADEKKAEPKEKKPKEED
jgi:hypothetical protein